MKKNFLEGCQKLDEGRYRIRENISISNKSLKKLPLNESNSLVESNGKKYKCISAYEFHIWELDKYNLNNRIYSTELAQHVVNENKATIAFMNHPSTDDGDMKDVCAVARNPRIKNGWLVADGYLIGQHGQLVEDILQAGADIQVSSSCLGSLDENGKVCLDENFELERLFDVVSSASNAYKHTLEQDIKLENVNVSNKSSDIKEEVNINNNNITKVDNKMTNDKKISKFSEKFFIDFVNRQLKEISDLDTKTKVHSYKELLESFKDDDVKDYSCIDKFRSDITDKLSESKKELDNLIEKGKETDTLKETKKQITEKYENLVKENTFLEKKYSEACNYVEQMKKYFNKVKNLYNIKEAECNGMIEAELYVESLKYSEDLENELKEAKVKFNEVLGKYRESNKRLKQIELEKKESQIKLNKYIEQKRYDTLKAQELKKIEEEKKLHELAELKKIEEAKYKETHANFRNDEEVTNYYLEMLSLHPYLKNEKERILKCKTQKEAFHVFLKIQEEYESKPSNFYENTKVGDLNEEVKFNFYANKMDNLLSSWK